MNEITLLLNGLGGDKAESNDKLIERVYDELRRMAAAKLAQERVGHTLQPTALVNEAYLRLVAGDAVNKWENRRHFLRGGRGNAPNSRGQRSPQKCSQTSRKR